MNPTGVLLVADVNGERFCLNLWEAISEGRLMVILPVGVDPDPHTSRLWINDAAGDAPENRESIGNFISLVNPHA